MNLLTSFLLMAAMLGGERDDQVRMLLFTSDNCPACQTVKPGVEHLLEKGYPIEVVNISEQPSWADRYRITQVPTFVLLGDGKELDRNAGAISPHQIADQINKATMQLARSGPIVRETAAQEEVYDGTYSETYSEPPGYSSPSYEQPVYEQPAYESPVVYESPDYSTPYSGSTAVESAPIESAGESVVSESEQAVDSKTADAEDDQGAVATTDDKDGNPSKHNDPARLLSDGRPGSDIYSKASHKSEKAVSATEKRAHRATVRFRIEDDEGTNHGSGTIIHIHDNEALVLTCGHIFRESKGTGRIYADVGFPDKQHTVRGKLLAYDAAEHDIALVVIQLEIPIEAVSLAPSDMRPHEGNNLFSFGCDRGADPTMRRGRMMRLSRYQGVTKYDVSNRPMDGRSGGGLYNAKGELVGVCNAADVNADEGIYAGLKTIHWQLADAGLTNVMKIPSRGPQERERQLEQLVDSDSTYGRNNSQPARTPGQAFSEVMQASATVDDLVPVTRAIREANGDVEMIIIVRSKQNPEKTNSFVLENPDQKLIRMVADQRRREEGSDSGERTASATEPVREIR